MAGVDCSTQTTKVLVVDAGDGRVLAQGRVENPVTGSSGARESDPEAWWSALAGALSQTGLADQVQAISIGAQQHGLVVLDERDQPLRPAILWNDVRAAGEAAGLVEELGAARWAERVGVVPVAALTISSWAWLRRAEPELARAVRAVRLPHDFLTERLCGEAVTDRGDASGTGWWSSTRERYDEEVLALPAVGLEVEKLPRVLGAAEPAGQVGSSAARETGLRAGTLVGPGTGDNMAAALALASDVGWPVISLGSSGTVYCVSGAPSSDPTGMVAGFADATGRFLPLACTLNATLAVDRVAAWLGLDREATEPGGEVTMLAFLDGERTPNLPAAAGTITGLRHSTSAGQILRAAYDGVVAALLLALEALDEVTGSVAAAAPITLIGGGARGAAWRESVLRLSGRGLVVPRAEELVALGAAVQAAAVLTGEDPAAVAGRWHVRDGMVLEPTPRDEETLDRYRSVLAATSQLNEGR